MKHSQILAFVVLLLIPVQLSGQFTRSRRETYPSAAPLPEARKDVVVTFQGKLKQMKKKEILIQSSDNQLLSIRRSKTTKFSSGGQEIKASDIDLETPISVDAMEDIDLKMIAVNVKIIPPPHRAMLPDPHP